MLIAMSSMVLMTVKAELRAVSERIDGRLAAMEQRLDHLDRDVQKLVEKIFPA